MTKSWKRAELNRPMTKEEKEEEGKRNTWFGIFVWIVVAACTCYFRFDLFIGIFAAVTLGVALMFLSDKTHWAYLTTTCAFALAYWFHPTASLYSGIGIGAASSVPVLLLCAGEPQERTRLQYLLLAGIFLCLGIPSFQVIYPNIISNYAVGVASHLHGIYLAIPIAFSIPVLFYLSRNPSEEEDARKVFIFQERIGRIQRGECSVPFEALEKKTIQQLEKTILSEPLNAKGYKYIQDVALAFGASIPRAGYSDNVRTDAILPAKIHLHFELEKDGDHCMLSIAIFRNERECAALLYLGDPSGKAYLSQ